MQLLIIRSASSAGLERRLDRAEVTGSNPVQNTRKKHLHRDAFFIFFPLPIGEGMGERLQLFEGIVNGSIIKERRGGEGFGYDPIFQPEGYDKTFAELGNEVKNHISHRARAVQKLADYLKSY